MPPALSTMSRSQYAPFCDLKIRNVTADANRHKILSSFPVFWWFREKFVRMTIETSSLRAGLARLAVGLHRLPPFIRSRTALISVCLLLVGIVGYVDYLTGYETSLLLLYLVPIFLATWLGTFAAGLMIAVAGGVMWVVAELSAGVPEVRFWNAGMALGAYVLFAGVLSKLRTLVRELDRRVQERTAALQREVAERQRLDQEMAKVADRERRRLGQDLHDRLGQHLTGTALAAEVLKEKLAARSAPEVPEAEKVVRYIEEGIDLTRDLARGFFSPELEADGLTTALQGLAENITERFSINCVFDGEESVQIQDSTVATQLYRIAQEAVTNAVKHAAARQIDIRLVKRGPEVTLAIIDDGVGISDELPQPEGLGLRLMRHGAALIGATINVRRNNAGGTIATCKLNIADDSDLGFR
jgi:signal transduction histidine kinase